MADIQIAGTLKMNKTHITTLFIDQEFINWLQEQYNNGETELAISFPDIKETLAIRFTEPPATRVRVP